jgi:DNA repair exonuclease SbcCD ATPase subunit
MIKSVHIKNFEAHADSFFEFENGINNISGTSNNGKSSVIKALNWCLFNQPAGFAFKKHNSKGTTSVRIEFTNGSYLERERGSQTNQYDCNGEILTALGSGVPDQVKELTDIENINIQNQFDQFFLLQESSGEVARTLNSIVGLEVIDSALYKSGKLVKDTKNKLSNKQEQEHDLTNSLSSYAWIDSCEEVLEQAILKTDDLQKLITKIEKCEALIKELEFIEYQLSKIIIFPISKVNELKKLFEEFTTLLTKINVVDNQCQRLDEIYTSLQKLIIVDLTDKITSIKDYIKDYEKMAEREINLGKLLAEDERRASAYKDTQEWLSCGPLYYEITGMLETKENLDNTINRIEKDLKRSMEIEDGARQIMAVIEKGRNREMQIKSEIKICPVCGKEFDGECC